MGLFETIYIPKTVVLPRKITANTIYPKAEADTCCPKCGAAYVEGKNFCVECGASRVKRHSLSMGNKRVKAVELAAYLSQWLAENPYLYNVEISCDMHHLANDFDRVGQVTATNVVLTYSISQKPMDIQYGVEYAYTYNATMNISEIMNAKGENAAKMWQMQNPHLKYHSYTGGRVTSTNGTYQQYALVVYSAPISPQSQQTVASRPAPAVKFCRHCGQKLTTTGPFCSHCGQKL